MSSVPEWFPLDTNFLVAVLEERGRTLRHHMLHPQSYLHVLEEPLHEPQEMLRCSDVPRHCLWKIKLMFSFQIRSQLEHKYNYETEHVLSQRTIMVEA